MRHPSIKVVHPIYAVFVAKILGFDNKAEFIRQSRHLPKTARNFNLQQNVLATLLGLQNAASLFENSKKIETFAVIQVAHLNGSMFTILAIKLRVLIYERFQLLLIS